MQEEDLLDRCDLSVNARAFFIDKLLNHVPDNSWSEKSDECNYSMKITEKVSPETVDNLLEENESSCHVMHLPLVTCILQGKGLWNQFHSHGTEMIVTKSGRRMFPTLRVAFQGLRAEEKYSVFLEFLAMDNHKYRFFYHRSEWLKSGKAEAMTETRLVPYPDCPISGERLEKTVLSFEKVKISNNVNCKQNHVQLKSMYKYQPTIHLVCHKDTLHCKFSSELKGLDHRSFQFPETQFIAVTAYQNQMITKLKIDNNPFAKGFRELSRNSRTDSYMLPLRRQHHSFLPRVIPLPMTEYMKAQRSMSTSVFSQQWLLRTNVCYSSDTTHYTKPSPVHQYNPKLKN